MLYGRAGEIVIDFFIIFYEEKCCFLGNKVEWDLAV
ncbi:hypothetical protein Clole_3617 [Cellulosilyticum lentocellum DSM 5427]|uniref:Uncharacterized protein n=1 Tax=Cellulosilyticum lentocellum (strain ATCC 49066 / DSM 5427 / NCIMB 11756 / RHM5) TaxID=642492 RepID=F2JGW0_CELLD|nr:hypothetical protein Clole_3617 [Cellulosilyticum lentocellum DSM 5427]